MASKNGWDNYQKLVLDKLEDHATTLHSLDAEVKSIRTEDIPGLQVEIAMLKIKAGVWGAAAGMIPAVLGVIYAHLSK